MTYKTNHEIEAVVHGFENCTTAKESFKHREHLTVAVWYLWHASEEQALERMRNGLIRFLNHHRVDSGKYKEELTVFWIKLIKADMDELNPGLSILEVTNHVVDRHGDPSVITDAASP